MTVFAGNIIYASDINNILAPGWTSYAASWTSSGTAPALGNGSLAARYRRAAGSDLIIYEGKLTWGSTTTNGTGTYSISLPVNASATAQSDNVPGACQILDAGTFRRPGQCLISGASTISFISLTSPGDVTGTNPQTFVTGDFIAWSIAYQPV